MSFVRKGSEFMGVSNFYIPKHFKQFFLNVYIHQKSVIYLKIIAEFVPERYPNILLNFIRCIFCGHITPNRSYCDLDKCPLQIP